MVKNDLLSGQYEGFRGLKLIPLVVRYAAGTPSVQYNPSNEDISLTDVGTGEVTVSLASAGIAPLIVPGISVRSSAPNTAGANANLKGASTSTAFTVVVNADTDGATETDPVDIHLLIVKLVESA